MASIAEGIVSPSDLLNSASSSIPEQIGEIQQLNGHSLIASSINEAESGANPDDPPINVAGHEHVDVNDETQQGVVQPDGDEEDDEDEEVDANGAVDPGVSMRVKVSDDFDPFSAQGTSHTLCSPWVVDLTLLNFLHPPGLRPPWR